MAGVSVLWQFGRRAPEGIPRRRWYISLLRDPSALLGGAVLLAMALAALLAPRLAPFDPPSLGDSGYFFGRSALPHLPPFWDRSGDTALVDDPNDPFKIYERRLPYDADYALGTDWQARDMLSLLLYGLRYSMPVGMLAVALVAVLGTALGLSAGWLGGVWDDLVTWASDTAEAVPALLAYALFAALLSDPVADVLRSGGLYLDGVPVTVLVLSCVGWAPVARLARGRALGLRHAEWALAARATGVPRRRILVRHVLPHTVGTVLVAASSQLPLMLLAEGLLGALGVGHRPSVDSLGELVFHEFPYTVSLPVYVLMPTALVIAMSLSVTALADGIGKALDPHRTG